MFDAIKKWFVPAPKLVAPPVPADIAWVHRAGELPWVSTARSYIGLREEHGAGHNPTILGWWQKLGATFRDDETPWCGAFVGGVLLECGLRAVTAPARAQAWLDLPAILSRPAYGCVVVFWRGSPTSGSGHVGFVVGQDKAGNLMVLGGNQGDAVSIKPFSFDRVLGFRWPNVWPTAARYDLPLLDSDGRVSTNEA